MFDLHTIIKNNEQWEKDVKDKRIALIKSELAKLDGETATKVIFDALGDNK